MKIFVGDRTTNVRQLVTDPDTRHSVPGRTGDRSCSPLAHASAQAASRTGS